MSSLPMDFLTAMHEQLGAEYPEFLRAMAQPPTRGLRLNPLKPLEEAVPGLNALEAVPWAAEGRYLSGETRAGAVALHEAGAWYLQDPGAMLPVSVLKPQPGEIVLDLCAAPGGKSTQIAGRLAGEGLLVSNEIVPRRAAVLSRNMERMGVPNGVVISAEPQALAARWPESFDAVLVDAPCSGEGMFRRHPETCDEWSLTQRAGCAARQAEILDAAAEMVRPGGRLVYATCTYNTLENEDNVTGFLARHPDFSLQPFQLPEVDGGRGMVTAFPHRLRGEGQFAALLVRAGDAQARPLGTVPLPAADRTARRALLEFDSTAPEAVYFGETLTRLAMPVDLRGLRALRVGLHLGTVRSGRLVPDHAWAVSACPPALSRLPLTEEAALRYLAGESVPTPENMKGWVLVTLCGLPLGFGKASGGQAKNHYPKGLRRVCEPMGEHMF